MEGLIEKRGLMLDTIDLKEQLERGNYFVKANRKRNRRMWTIIVIMLLLALALQFIGTRAVLGQLYEYRDGGVIESAPNFAALEIRRAPDGTLWAINIMVATLYRYDGTSWNPVSNSGASLLGVNEIAFYENEVWLLMETELQVFDGASWKSYPLEGGTSSFKGFAVGSFGAAVLDESGNITILQDGEWQHYQVDDFLGFEERNDYTFLSLISDGKKLYLSGDGLVSFDGNRWRGEADYDPYALIIGQDEEHIWLVNYDYGDELIRFEKSTGDLDYIDSPLLSSSAWIMQMDYDNGRYIFASDEGIVEYDGHDWTQSLAQGDIPLNTIRGAVLTDTGYIFSVIPLGEDEFRNSLLGIVISQVCGVLLVFAVVIPFFYSGYHESKAAQSRVALTRKRLPDLLPDMPEYMPLYTSSNSKKRDWGGLKYTLGLLLKFLISFGLILPINLYLGLFCWLFLSFGDTLILALFKHNADAQSRAYLLRGIFSVALFSAFLSLVLGGFVLLVFQAIPFLLQYVAQYLVISIALFIFSIMGLGLFAMRLYTLIPYYFVMQPFWAGNPEKSLKRLGFMRRISPKDMSLLFHHGFMMLELGQWQEAEKLWREVITEAQNSNPGFLGPCLVNLANALQAQGKIDEALRLHEAAVKIQPESPGAYRELAQWYLHYSEYPQAAIEHTELMLHFAVKPRLNLTAERYMWGVHLYTRALALAVVGQKENALAMLERAFKESDKNKVPAQAFLRLYAGHVHKALGDTDTARRYYQEAKSINSAYSTYEFATKALAQLDASIA
jgi:tetratricopeptide (TPR) repeat protein